MRVATVLACALWIAVSPMRALDKKLKPQASYGGPILRMAQMGEYDRVIPFVVDGGGWKTTFVLTNPDNKALYFAVWFVADDGSDMELPIVDLGGSILLWGDLQANETVVFETEGTAGSLQEGYALFYVLDRSADDPDVQAVAGPLAGMAILRRQLTEQTATETTVPMSSRYENRFTLPFDNRPGGATAMMLVNSGSRPNPVTLTVRDDNGKVLTKDSVTVDSGKRIWGAIPDLYPQTVGRTGSIQVSSANVTLTGLGMRQIASGPMITVPVFSSDLDPDAPQRPPLPSSALPGFTNTACSVVEGVLLFADDGQFLGRVTKDKAAADSVTNTSGRYGSAYSSVSIFNPSGKYGGESSALSPFNPFTTKPPVMFFDGKAIAYLTLNSDKGPAVDTNSVLRCVGRQ